MAKFRHAEFKTDMIRAIMLTMPPSDNKQHLEELVRYVSSVLLCMHNSPLSPDAAAANCVRGILLRDRHMTAKTRNALRIVSDTKRGSALVIHSLVQAVNQIEADYTAKVNSGLFTAA